MNAKETLYETKISDERWWAYDIPGNAGWIAYLACLFHSLKRGLNTFNIAALLPGGLMGLGVGELISAEAPPAAGLRCADYGRNRRHDRLRLWTCNAEGKETSGNHAGGLRPLCPVRRALLAGIQEKMSGSKDGKAAEEEQKHVFEI